MCCTKSGDNQDLDYMQLYAIVKRHQLLGNTAKLQREIQDWEMLHKVKSIYVFAV